MLEIMHEFFNKRVDGYEEHQLNAIEGAREFYPFTASCLPADAGARGVDLGCGTGLELGYYFARNPAARVTGIDLAADMLRVLRERFAARDVTTVQGSYFDVAFGEECYDAAVSVESLHHFTQEEKIPLYGKVYRALVPGGSLILTDYFAPSAERERFSRRELLRLKQEQGIADGAFYHYDTPLTEEHEIEALRAAGFSSVRILQRWGATSTVKAVK